MFLFLLPAMASSRNQIFAWVVGANVTIYAWMWFIQTFICYGGINEAVKKVEQTHYLLKNSKIGNTSSCYI